ncbi:MAG TPA: sulfatase-like hydrolase/transferase [Candidatus Hydrogenedentes bacterium]|nr:sulfatase-like hydrolase/transferase [Candidatus Hydrogenedentota bacterium]HRT18672.1 sulfatase-like hydrolase/transferase [Candidatus Hydrogenedentota bacterium]HRT63692.1 sulfatase-like hydrolase/transferase [Candidatus Hydrogenedentota bacterium]
MRRIISGSLKIIVTGGLFLLLFRPQTFGLRPDQFGGVTPMALLEEIRAADASNLAVWLLLAVVIKLSGMLAGIARWQLLLKGQGLYMPFWYMTQSWFVGRMFGIFMPGTIGLDGYRLYDSSLYTKEPLKCTTLIAVEKLIGFISLTFLVFLTFPLGFRLLKINVAILGVILFVLGVFVLATFLLLLNPRVIQVIVSVVPAPGAVRRMVDKLGASITAYSGQRLLLLAAVVCGLWVHFATCLMYFCTMTALRAPNTGLLDVLFASPIMIYGTVIGPSVGGEGIREIVFATLLGGKSGVSAAVLFSHLGWWVGDVVPFLIGLPIFLIRSRPGRAQLQAELAEARKQAPEDTHVRLTPWAIVEYRRNLINCLIAGIAAGLVTGGLGGIGEAAWFFSRLSGLAEGSAFWWGPAVYGLVFAAVGAGVAGALAFLYLLIDKFPPLYATFGLAMAGTSGLAGVVAIWRYMRDVLIGHVPNLSTLAPLLAAIASAALFAGLAGALFHGVVLRGRWRLLIASVMAWGLIVGGGSLYAVLGMRHPALPAFSPPAHSSGPNIVLIVVDALRADGLSVYNPQAKAHTPQLNAFAKDCVVFNHWFTQAPWTKPAFASIFTGRYPESHTATTKISMLPQGIGAFPENLRNAGYYTKGFANNPHIMSPFHFDQGFCDYVDLKPRLYFYAGPSAAKLAVYEVLRHAWHALASKVYKRMNVRDFYQPAEDVTDEALAWIESPECPKNAPFFLFLHYMDPHDPFMDHAKPGVGYARVRMEHPDPDTFLEPMKEAYDSEIAYMDIHLGRLFDGLRRYGLYDNTIVLFTSDHGEEFFEHRGWWHGQTLFDELLHVPCLIKLPRSAHAGERNTGLGRHVDIAPTLLQLAGAPPLATAAGQAVMGPDGAFANAGIAFVYAENDFENNVLQGIRTLDKKVIHSNPDNPRRQPPVSCYDLRADPGEQHNLAASGAPCDPGLEKALTDLRAFSRGQGTQPALAGPLTEEQRSQLEGLGYLGGK